MATDPKAVVAVAFKPHMAPGAALTMREEGDRLIVTLPDPALNGKLKGMRDTTDQARLDKYFTDTGGEETPAMNIGPQKGAAAVNLVFSKKELQGIPADQVAGLLQREVQGMLSNLGHEKIGASGAAVTQTASLSPTQAATTRGAGNTDPTRADPAHMSPEQLQMAIACFKPQPGKRRGTGGEGPEVRTTDIAYHPSSGNLPTGTHVSPSSAQSAGVTAPDCAKR